MEKVKKILSQLSDANADDIEKLSDEESEELAGGLASANISCGPKDKGCGPNTGCGPTVPPPASSVAE